MSGDASGGWADADTGGNHTRQKGTMMSTHTLTTGGDWPPATRQNPAPDSRPHDTPRPSHWLSGGAMALVGGGGLLIGTLLMILYGFIASLTGASHAARAMLLSCTVVLVLAALVALLLAWQERIRDRREQYRLAVLRTELDQTAAAMATTATALQAALAELPEQVRDRWAAQGKVIAVTLDGMEQRQVEVVAAVRDLGERLRMVEGGIQADASGALAGAIRGLAELRLAVRELGDRMDSIGAMVDEDWLRGFAAWAAQIDQRLTEVQRATRSTGETVPAGSNGHREESPMELSDEALRGYFLGFYDRSKGNPDGASE